jgi:hypothetical protein
VPGPGRNQPCSCGSGRKTKHCCGEQRGPSEDQLARAHVATLAQQAIPDLAGLSDHALQQLSERLMDLPALDLSLLVALPKLIGPDLQRLRESIELDDADWGWDALTAVHHEIDTPQQTSTTRQRDRPTPRPTTDRSPSSRLRAARPPHPINPLHRRQPARSRRRLNRCQPHPRRPPDRRLTRSIYPGEVARGRQASAPGRMRERARFG